MNISEKVKFCVVGLKELCRNYFGNFGSTWYSEND